MGTFLKTVTTSMLLVMALVQCSTAARSKISSMTGGTAFECPAECLECCDATSLRSAFFDGTPFKKFKCLLRGSEVPPEAGRGCSPPAARNSYKNRIADGKFKTYCSYIGSEDRDTNKKCSKDFQCCCPQEDNFQEDRCFDGAQQGLRQEVANHNGEMASFGLSHLWPSPAADGQLVANRGACKLRAADGNLNIGLSYTWARDTAPTHKMKPPKSLTLVTDGCCLATRTESVSHRWEDSSADIGAGAKYKTAVKEYTMCTEHEMLHVCSNDGGLTPNGQFRYERYMTQVPGTCVGDKQASIVGMAPYKLGNQTDTPNGRCPQPLGAGRWCACEPKC